MCLRQEILACPDKKAEQQYGSELETPTDVPLLGIQPSTDTHAHTWGHTHTRNVCQHSIAEACNVSMSIRSGGAK